LSTFTSTFCQRWLLLPLLLLPLLLLQLLLPLLLLLLLLLLSARSCHQQPYTC
jgi:hypothetical protein